MSRKIRCYTTKGSDAIVANDTIPHLSIIMIIIMHHGIICIMHLTSSDSIQMLKVNYPMNQTVNFYNRLTFPDSNHGSYCAKKYGYEEILRSCYVTFR